MTAADNKRLMAEIYASVAEGGVSADRMKA